MTLKMDVSHTEHSHVIGKGGNNIKRVMDDTGCHIHFPDSNRNNQSDKSNQVKSQFPNNLPADFLHIAKVLKNICTVLIANIFCASILPNLYTSSLKNTECTIGMFLKV